MIDPGKRSGNVDAEDFADDDLLDRLCGIIGIRRTELLDPFDPAFPLSPAARRTLDTIEDSDLRACFAHLLYLRERSGNKP